MKGEKLIGKLVLITDKESWFCGEWGYITGYFDVLYSVAIANGTDSEPVFERWQFRVPRHK